MPLQSLCPPWMPKVSAREAQSVASSHSELEWVLAFLMLEILYPPECSPRRPWPPTDCGKTRCGSKPIACRTVILQLLPASINTALQGAAAVCPIVHSLSLVCISLADAGASHETPAPVSNLFVFLHQLENPHDTRPQLFLLSRYIKPLLPHGAQRPRVRVPSWGELAGPPSPETALY